MRENKYNFMWICFSKQFLLRKIFNNFLVPQKDSAKTNVDNEKDSIEIRGVKNPN